MALCTLLLAGDGDVLLAAMHGLIKAQGDPHTDILTLAGGSFMCSICTGGRDSCCFSKLSGNYNATGFVQLYAILWRFSNGISDGKV